MMIIIKGVNILKTCIDNIKHIESWMVMEDGHKKDLS